MRRSGQLGSAPFEFESVRRSLHSAHGVTSGSDATARRAWLNASFASVLFACAALWAAPLQAKVDAESPYTLSQTFSAALRMLRVDLNLEVTEKDSEASYLLFNYSSAEDPKRLVSGAIELIPQNTAIKVVIKIPQLPQSHERLLRDRLIKKLKDDYGPPPKQPEPPKPPEGTPDKPPDKSDKP